MQNMCKTFPHSNITDKLNGFADYVDPCIPRSQPKDHFNDYESVAVNSIC